MTDIVESLRDRQLRWKNEMEKRRTKGLDQAAAAAEIERLRTMLHDADLALATFSSVEIEG